MAYLLTPTATDAVFDRNIKPTDFYPLIFMRTAHVQRAFELVPGAGTPGGDGANPPPTEGQIWPRGNRF